ncbi:N-acetylmuramoyl-L-alanine amidase [Mongoliimonas terrestris]|uniref:N-acetylmuramoyl-L-alanine amidase n=1 Tax=Mongoliimonas terrestris TaxID=1709001 RepID=UPI0009FB22BC|nr:N-acetylmuramoyl-L-alanine amidase [Mongoliimonas terrestris]
MTTVQGSSLLKLAATHRLRRAVLAAVLILAGATLARAELPSDPAVAPPVSAGGVLLPVASDARVVGDGERTRFVLDLSGPVEISAFTLGDPYRVVVDLPEVTFRLPDDAGLTGRGLVTGWRYGLFARGRSRLVIDATGPVTIDGAFVLKGAEGAAARLVVDLVRSTPEDFQSALQKTALTREASNTVGVTKGDRLRADSGRERPLIMLDPGHGGVDAGTIASSGIKEKDVVLAFAEDLKRRLEATGKVDVSMTRTDDTFIPLGDRVRIAREAAADLFVSIHADSVREDHVRGATVYTLSERASDRAAAALADKENAADAVAGLELEPAEAGEVSDILIDLTRRETQTFSASFANTLVGELSNTTRMIRNPHRSAGFWVLRAPDVPSVLLEIGYLSNEEDEQLLTNNDWRGKVADAVSAAMLRFLQPKIAAAGQ